MKNAFLIILLFTTSIAFSQYSQVRFKEGTFENGMLYPIAISPGLPEVSERINTHLQKQISDLKASDFCIGQYGYVQKGDIIQIHIFCNCIDFSESQNRYYIYNVDNGKSETNMGIIDERKIKKFSVFLLNKVKVHTEANNTELTDSQLNEIKTNQLNAFKMILSKDGINLWLNESWGEKALFISWTELKAFMRYS